MRNSFLFTYLLFMVTITIAESDIFRFSGLRLGMSPEDIQTLYPNSRPNRLSADGFYMRLSPQDTKEDHIHFISIQSEGSNLRRLKISFEAPSKPGATDSSSAEYEERHPLCANIRQALVKQYGQWDHLVEFFEEALGHKGYLWRSQGQFMRLECGSYYGRSRSFAMDIVLGYTKDDCDLQLHNYCSE